MLISLTVENWKSFRNLVSFSMIKTRERQHNERVPRLVKYDVGILPVAAMYGGNASGKTNLFSALSFMKKFVVKQRAPDEGTGVTPFLLSDETRTGLTKFTARILTTDDVVNNTLIKMEPGENQNPTLDTLEKIAKALDVSVDDLMK